MNIHCKAAVYYTLKVRYPAVYEVTEPCRADIFRKWVLDSVSPDKKDSAVKEKQLEALERLGHLQLELNEYERTSG